jgi:flagellar biosynthesis protein FliR
MQFTDLDALGIFLVFCRIGTATMLLPGFALTRAPVMFRVMLALAMSAAVYPLQQSALRHLISRESLVLQVLNELLTGLFIGFLCALFVYAVRFAAHFILSIVGLAGIPGQPVEDMEANPPFVLLISMCFTALIFALDLHLTSFRALSNSYTLFPLGQGPAFEVATSTISELLRDTSLMALQASSPFILYALAINFALGLIGKLTPQLQAYFAVMGLSTLLALVLMAIIGSPLLTLFASSYGSWIETGL